MAVGVYRNDPSTFKFPNNCSRRQFLDYWDTVFIAFDQAESPLQEATAAKAAQAWSSAYHFEKHLIKKSKPRKVFPATIDTGDNRNPTLHNAQDDLAKRALRAARLVPHARVSDVSKALRTAAPIALNDNVLHQIQQCYPSATAEEKTTFDPKPLAGFTVDRDALARVIMSRAPKSHPGASGITFDVLQHFCLWTYKLEDEHNPDPRWDRLCRLVSKIMSGNATALSHFLLDVIGAVFNKNAEKLDGSFALRNLGIEESLLRIAATLVFERVLPPAMTKGFLSYFDLGAGKKAGAEIFGRIAAMLSRSGAPVAVFDVVKAFNNLRRKDIMEAVAAFNHPLLTAFVHFLFSRDSKVSFKCPLSGHIFDFFLTKGIHQGNPLSVFLFCLTIAYILKPLRTAYPNAIVAAFVDDIYLGMHKDHVREYPAFVREFMQLFQKHGLQFDLSSSAKSSVFSIHPLPDDVASSFRVLGIKCQNNGIAPCKIPTGSASFIQAFAAKATAKLHNRFLAFKALWPALLRYSSSLRRPVPFFEHYLNLVRLSFISMPTYVLRTLTPSACVAYSRLATEWALALIHNVLPPSVPLPRGEASISQSYPNLLSISSRILQLPLARGGLSLRLPDSIKDIAYAASCIDCMPAMHVAASRIKIRCAQFLVPELQLTQQRIRKLLPSLTLNTWLRLEDSEDDLRTGPLQQQLTVMLNAAEIDSIAADLTPWPEYYLTFTARVDKKQEHVSWPINPRARGNLQLAALSDAEFSRTISIAILHPFIDPRVCSCGGTIDPAGFHLLSCKHNHYGVLHDRVKHAVAARIRSLVTAEIAPITVLLEQPMSSHFPLRSPAMRDDPMRVADLIVSLHSELQQHVVACDFVSCFARNFHADKNYHHELSKKAREKRKKYANYALTTDNFFPLPFGRTNVLSPEICDFCSMVDRHFPNHFHAERKLRATFSRAIYVGTSQLMNLAVRRLQLSVTARVRAPLVSPAAVLSPYASLSRYRLIRRPPHKFSSTHALLIPRLAAILAGSLLDSQEAESQGVEDETFSELSE